MVIKALSLLQPWATLVVTGNKEIETRSWTTKYRGRLLIHASKGRSGALIAKHEPIAKYISDFNALLFGAIIGEATLKDIIRTEQLYLPETELDKLTLEEKAFGDYRSGRYAWLLEDAIQYDEPIPATGKMGLWEF